MTAELREAAERAAAAAGGLYVEPRHVAELRRLVQLYRAGDLSQSHVVAGYVEALVRTQDVEDVAVTTRPDPTKGP